MQQHRLTNTRTACVLTRSFVWIFFSSYRIRVAIIVYHSNTRPTHRCTFMFMFASRTWCETLNSAIPSTCFTLTSVRWIKSIGAIDSQWSITDSTLENTNCQSPFLCHTHTHSIRYHAQHGIAHFFSFFFYSFVVFNAIHSQWTICWETRNSWLPFLHKVSHSFAPHQLRGNSSFGDQHLAVVCNLLIRWGKITQTIGETIGLFQSIFEYTMQFIFVF